MTTAPGIGRGRKKAVGAPKKYPTFFFILRDTNNFRGGKIFLRGAAHRYVSPLTCSIKLIDHYSLEGMEQPVEY